MTKTTCKTFYVYYMHPTPTTPTWHYDYYPTTTEMSDLPDICHYTPQWIFNERSGRFTAVSREGLWERHIKAGRLSAKLAMRVKGSLEGLRFEFRRKDVRRVGALGLTYADIGPLQAAGVAVGGSSLPSPMGSQESKGSQKESRVKKVTRKLSSIIGSGL